MGFLLGLSLLLVAGCGERPEDRPDAGAAEPGPDLPLPEAFLHFGDVAPDPEAFLAILEAEDRRAMQEGDLALLVFHADAPHPGIRRAAVRAMGRLERPAVAEILPVFLEDADPAVRGEVANALAQSMWGAGPGEAGRVRALLGSAVARLSSPAGVMARSMARLPLHGEEELREGEDALLLLLRTVEGVSEEDRREAARGALFLYRNAMGEEWEAAPELVAELESLSRTGSEGATRLAAAQARRAALPTSHSPALLRDWLEDEDPEVRREGAQALASAWEEVEGAERARLLELALDDPDARVRVEGVRSLGEVLQGTTDREWSGGTWGGERVLQAMEDESHHVALAALEVSGELPPTSGQGETGVRAEVKRRLEALARGLPPEAEGDWHEAVGALGALAQGWPEEALTLLPLFTEHPSPFVRTHVTRVAGGLGEWEVVEALALDVQANPRQAAIATLAEGGRGASLELLTAQLALDDPYLLRTTAQLLDPLLEAGLDPEVQSELVEALAGALDRLSADGALTHRDARIPLLRSLARAGAEDALLEAHLTDYDPAVAREASDLLFQRTGELHRVGPSEPPLLPLPTLEELREMEEVRVEVEMVRGGSFVLRLLPFEAPTNAARFYRMAREGVFQGLTLHRVVSNFVVQGGSPGANEYAGHGAYTRDELGLPGHWRGTAGISTRGRDTGDGQIFMNLVPNLRLDHNYTVFGVVVEGMEVVDRIREGDQIAAVRVGSEG